MEGEEQAWGVGGGEAEAAAGGCARRCNGNDGERPRGRKEWQDGIAAICGGLDAAAMGCVPCSRSARAASRLPCVGMRSVASQGLPCMAATWHPHAPAHTIHRAPALPCMKPGGMHGGPGHGAWRMAACVAHGSGARGMRMSGHGLLLATHMRGSSCLSPSRLMVGAASASMAGRAQGIGGKGAHTYEGEEAPQPRAPPVQRRGVERSGGEERALHMPCSLFILW